MIWLANENENFIVFFDVLLIAATVRGAADLGAMLARALWTMLAASSTGSVTAFIVLIDYTATHTCIGSSIWSSSRLMWTVVKLEKYFGPVPTYYAAVCSGVNTAWLNYSERRMRSQEIRPGDLDLWPLEAKIGTSVTPAEGNVHANLGFSAPFSFLS